MDPLLTFALVVFFLLAEGFFSGCELALASFSKVRLRHLAESGESYAIILTGLLKSPERVFGTTSVGTNLSVFASSAVVTGFLYGIFGERADFYSFLIMGPVTLVLGEIVPKIVFRHNADTLWPFMARPLAMCQSFFKPLLNLTTASARVALKIVLRQKASPTTFVSREEILLLTKMSESKLDLDVEEQKMIDRIFEFKTSDVDVAMQPLVNIAAVSDMSTIKEARMRLAETGYSRLPVYHKRIYNIVGIVSAFDILRQPDQNIPVVKIMSPAYYTPNTKKNSQLLKEMQASGAHMSVVVDEYGAAIGIVTIEDLLEEIVGEIEDEYDVPAKSYEKTGEGRYIVDATMEIDNLNEELGLDLPTGDYETVNGLIIEALERIPKKRDRLAIGPYLLTVLDATPLKTTSVEIEDLRDAPSGGGGDGEAA